jgi:hypothetical protein
MPRELERDEHQFQPDASGSNTVGAGEIGERFPGLLARLPRDAEWEYASRRTARVPTAALVKASSESPPQLCFAVQMATALPKFCPSGLNR